MSVDRFAVTLILEVKDMDPAFPPHVWNWRYLVESQGPDCRVETWSVKRLDVLPNDSHLDT